MKVFVFNFFIFLSIVFVKGEPVQKDVVVITAYFPLGRSKHSEFEYKKWINNFFHSVISKLFIFTQSNYVNELKQIYINSTTVKNPRFIEIEQDDDAEFHKVSAVEAHVVFITAYSSPDKLPPVKTVKNDLITWQHQIDPEKHIHSPELYMIWTSKPWFVRRISGLNIFKNKNTFYMWVDIGSRRTKYDFGPWPDAGTVQESLREFNTSKPILAAVSKNSRYLSNDVSRKRNNQDFIIGGYFICKKEACELLEKYFYETRDSMIKRKMFAGKEQDVMDTMVLKNSEKFYAVDLSIPDSEKYCGNFYGFMAEKAIKNDFFINVQTPKILEVSDLI